MLFKFPYTDMYALNLDYILTKIKEFEEFVGTTGTLVFTVNGRHGDVIITKEEITEIVGGIVNSINGKSGEVVLTPEDIKALLGDYVVRFNNRIGDVTLRAEDVAATRLESVWTSDYAGQVITDLTQEELDDLYNSGKRILLFYNNAGIPDRVYFLTLVADTATPILYSPAELESGVVSVNGLTGIVNIYSTDIPMSSSAGANSVSAEIIAIKNKDTVQDTAITAIQQKDTAQDNAISALQQKDTLHDSEITAIESDIAELEQVFTGATSTADGAKGLVPAPTNTQIAQYLKATGNFETVAAGEVSSAAVSGAGTVEAALAVINSGATSIDVGKLPLTNYTVNSSNVLYEKIFTDGGTYLVVGSMYGNLATDSMLDIWMYVDNTILSEVIYEKFNDQFGGTFAILVTNSFSVIANSGVVPSRVVLKYQYIRLK